MSKYFVPADLKKKFHAKFISIFMTYRHIKITSEHEQQILNTEKLPLSYLFGLNVGICELISPLLGIRILSYNLVER